MNDSHGNNKTPKEETLELLPNTKGAIVILSGGMDSTIATRLAVEKYGKENVHTISFNYGQRQSVELERAKVSTSILGVTHEIVNLGFLRDFSMGFSANVDPGIKMPTIKEVLGDPRPKTYVPNRNMIMLTIAAAKAETVDVTTVVAGLQIHDAYGYWDTTKAFVDAMNAILNQNREIKIQIVAPFSQLSKKKEIQILQQLDGDVSLLKHTMTCYNPQDEFACGVCPSCSERIKAFKDTKLVDPVPYIKEINWFSE